MKTKVKICFALFPLMLILVLAFRSGQTISECVSSIYQFFNQPVWSFGNLSKSLHTLLKDYLGIGWNVAYLMAIYFAYLIYVGLGFLLYDLFLWFGSFVKSFK